MLVLGEMIGSLAQGIQQTFSRLTEGRLENTNYVVIIVTAPGQETQSCVVVTGGSCLYMCVNDVNLLSEFNKKHKADIKTGYFL